MTEELETPDVTETRPRFQIVDLFAIIFAIATGFGFVRMLSDDSEAASLAVWGTVCAIVLVHPAAVAMQFAWRRRQRAIGWKDTIGMLPAGAILGQLLALAPGGPHLAVAAFIFLGMMSLGNAVVGLSLLMLDRPKSTWYWTDWYGCILAVLLGFFVVLLSLPAI